MAPICQPVPHCVRLVLAGATLRDSWVRTEAYDVWPERDAGKGDRGRAVADRYGPQKSRRHRYANSGIAVVVSDDTSTILRIARLLALR